MQHNSLQEDRILSLDVRPKSLAYSVFERPTHLVDFGVSGSALEGFQAERVGKLVRRFQPEVIVLRKILAGSSRDTMTTRAAIQDIRSKARRLSVPVVLIEKRLIEKTFRREGKPTKHKIAILLGACFPALAWYVPPQRKAYMPEDRRMQYFDAAAVGLSYFASRGNADAVQQLLVEGEARAQSLASKSKS